ncbi:O-antigen ligase family protein [Brumimicrobium aurantiacum]|uniref:O-antigen ligase-related domain-containing protein n=1 Tax=Brumimicrobium aurantiacum TaxID=1737063 RepID=A0A3E1F0I0_9FLAO|nr:O-antigen ligase family protein [Brumimicrobium aurantiacum]RFC55321.1 hypothetical protein DXU93_05730 [Brumimicrobium aurantiacum]
MYFIPTDTTPKNNKYDYFLIGYIALVVFGMYGNAFQPIRIITLASLPFIVIQCAKSTKGSFIFRAYTVSIFLYLAIISSIFWTPDLKQGLKEIVYYFTHLSVFVLIAILYSKANNPLRSLTRGWFFLILFTSFIALIEIFLGIHLSVNLIADDFKIQTQSFSAAKKYASVTFGNYNTYVMVITMSIPFLYSYIYTHKKFGTQILGIIILAYAYFALMINASRGGLIAGAIVFFIWMFYIQKLKVHHFKKKLLLFIPISAYVAIFQVKTFFREVSNRAKTDISIVKENGRFDIIINALEKYLEKPFFGSGIGSIQTVLKDFKYTVPHNLILEFLIQFGGILSLIVLFFILKMLLRIPKLELKQKAILVSTLFALPFIFVINSNYLLQPVLWVFIGSIYCVSYYKKPTLQHD